MVESLEVAAARISRMVDELARGTIAVTAASAQERSMRGMTRRVKYAQRNIGCSLDLILAVARDAEREDAA